MGTVTPWGMSDHSERIVRGITSYDTPSHGGLHVSAGLLAQMPPSWREVHGYPAGWFEEDCDWALVVLAFPDVFVDRPGCLEHALECVERWNADKLDDFTPAMRELYEAALNRSRSKQSSPLAS